MPKHQKKFSSTAKRRVTHASKFVYAICYCQENGCMLVARKRRFAYFYGNHNGDMVETVFPHGKFVDHGGGLLCFPGGGLEESNPLNGAKREFCEETGENINDYKVLDIKILSLIDGVFPYYGVFFRFSRQELTRLFYAIYYNLSDKNDKMRRLSHNINIKETEYTNVVPINWNVDYFNTKIRDDELESVFDHCKMIKYATYFQANVWFYNLIKDFLLI